MNLLKLITPINLDEEEIKFHSNKDYHPKFRYKWENSEPIISQTIHPLKLKLITAVLNQNIKTIYNTALDYFQVDLTQNKTLAEKIISTKPKPIQVQSLMFIEKEFENAFTYFNLNHYKLEISSKKGFNFRPQPTRNRIVMSKYAELQFFSIAGEVKHEMTHIIRYENSKYNKVKKSLDYLATEEGLATHFHDKFCTNGSSEYQHAAEYLASDIGRKGSLRDIYDFFRSLGFNNKLAWQRATRHKFGIIDTSQPGDIIKPAMYFHHAQKIANLTNHEKLRLFVGKISLPDLEKYPTYQGHFSANLINEFYQL